MEIVLSRHELVSEIVCRVNRRGDLARCSAVSKLWNQCCEAPLKAEPDHHLLAIDIDHRLWTLNLTTLEHRRHTFPAAGDTGGHSPLFHKVMATCEGVILLRATVSDNHHRHLVVAEPCAGKWQLLPEPPLEVVSAALLRNERRQETSLELFIMDHLGNMACYNFEFKCWQPHGSGPRYLANTGTIQNLFYHQGGFLMLFALADLHAPEEELEDTSERLMWYSLRSPEQEWVRVRMDPKVWSPSWYNLMHWQGRVLILGGDLSVRELVLYFDEVDEFEVSIEGEVVEFSRMLLANYADVLLVNAGNGDVFYACPEALDVFRLSFIEKGDLNLSYNIKRSFRPQDQQCFSGILNWKLFKKSFTSDGGDTIFQFFKKYPPPPPPMRGRRGRR